MTISKGDRYCSARREKGTCDAGAGIAVHELEERVLNGLRDILLGNDGLVAEFAAEFKRRTNPPPKGTSWSGQKPCEGSSAGRTRH